MQCNKLLVTVILTLFCSVFSEDAFLNETIHVRVKRAKYYHYPQRFYRRPPATYPTKGAFSHTPPPGYMMDDEEPHPAKPKVSRRPNDGLRDDDINNIVKYLSKQDLDKLIEFASEKERIRDNSVERRPYKRDESRVTKVNVQDYTDLFPQYAPYKLQDLDQKFNLNGPSMDQFSQKSPYKIQDSDLKFNMDQFSQKGPYNIQDSDQKFNLDPFSQKGPYKIQDSDQKFNLNGPLISQDESPFSQSFKSQDNFYNGPYRTQNVEQFKVPPKTEEPISQGIYNGLFAPNEDLLNYVEDAIQSKTVYVNHDKYSNTPLQTDESMQNKQISYINEYIHHEINDLPHNVQAPANIFTDNGVMREEVLPRPVNLREEDFDISYTNNVPTVVKAPSYEVENFGDLPLMSNAHKLDTVSSYKVPHYTVTSNSKYGPLQSSSSLYSSSSSNVPLEPAPPISAAKEQSDAHLKAIKIWTHRSKGTAYTLHRDGTLSLERPGRPKTKYGP